MSPEGRRSDDAARTPAPGLPSDERALLAALRRGDEEAFETLVREYGGRLFAVARRFVRSEEDARDALQDAFLSAFRSLARFEENCRLSTWLHRIVVNSCLMKLRTRRRKAEDSIEDLLPRFHEDGHQAVPSAGWEKSADVLLESREVRDLVRAAIDRLPESYRTVLMLRDIEELDTAETARLLDLTENAVKIRLHRARQALRGLLDPSLRPAAAC
ncbi:MAG: sigma-70 family RNA polymerase sigma factor [Acidobacteriota bacterium]